MPEISRFYGIVIRIYFGDHPPSHFHAVYAEHTGVYDMGTLKLTEGHLPLRAQRLVLEWARINKDEMLKMWETQEFHRLPPLE